ncbi:MAG: hypothetical protein ACYDG3_04815 [Bacillati bacterium]
MSFIDTAPSAELFTGLARLLSGETHRCRICDGFSRHRTCTECRQLAIRAAGRTTGKRP